MPSDKSQPSFVLVRPQMGENIGAAARAMWNFGLDRMRIVAPRDGWPNPKAVAMSSGAGRLLDEAQLFDDLAGALEDSTFVFATTARQRGLTKPVYSPERAMQLAAEKVGAGQKVAVLFGPERAGLENEDIARANAIISVPVDPEFASLNLAQAVGVFCASWGAGQGAVGRWEGEKAGVDAPAPKEDLIRMFEHLEEELERAGYFYPPDKTPLMKTNIRNAFIRGNWTTQEVRTFRGAIKALALGRGKARVKRSD